MTCAPAMRGRALVLEVDAEAHPDLAQAYRVRGIPHFAVIVDGAVPMQQSGLVDRRAPVKWLEQAGARTQRAEPVARARSPRGRGGP